MIMLNKKLLLSLSLSLSLPIQYLTIITILTLTRFSILPLCQATFHDHTAPPPPSPRFECYFDADGTLSQVYLHHHDSVPFQIRGFRHPVR